MDFDSENEHKSSGIYRKNSLLERKQNKKESINDEIRSYNDSAEEDDQIFNNDMIFNFLAKTSLRNVEISRILGLVANID